jgi:hypothetical protein
MSYPDGYEPVAVLALGDLGDLESLPEDLQTRETALRTRKPLEEFVFSGRWGHTSSLAAQARRAPWPIASGGYRYGRSRDRRSKQ